MVQKVALRRTTEKPVKMLLYNDKKDESIEVYRYLFTDTGLITKWNFAVRVMFLDNVRRDKIVLKVEPDEPKDTVVI